MPLKEVVLRSSWNPAKVIKREDLGHITVGAPADVAVLRLEKGKFGFLDQYSGRFDGALKLGCEVTLRDGTVVYDLNGRAASRGKRRSPQRSGGR
jgi:dihydroorotase